MRRRRSNHVPKEAAHTPPDAGPSRIRECSAGAPEAALRRPPDSDAAAFGPARRLSRFESAAVHIPYTRPRDAPVSPSRPLSRFEDANMRKRALGRGAREQRVGLLLGVRKCEDWKLRKGGSGGREGLAGDGGGVAALAALKQKPARSATNRTGGCTISGKPGGATNTCGTDSRGTPRLQRHMAIIPCARSANVQIMCQFALVKS